MRRIGPTPHDEFYTGTTRESLARYTKSTTGRGREISDQYAALIREWKDAQPVLTRCAFCPWFHQGTLAEGREKHAQHRTEHTEARREPRRNPKRSFISGTDLQENIARVREQGGHHWEEEAA